MDRFGLPTLIDRSRKLPPSPNAAITIRVAFRNSRDAALARRNLHTHRILKFYAAPEYIPMKQLGENERT